MSRNTWPLTANERACLRWIVDRLDEGDTRLALLDQVEAAAASGRTAMHTELDLVGSASRVRLPDGPLGVRATAFGTNDRPIGFVTVWLETGRLCMLSFGWVTDAMPDDFPPATSLRLDERD